MIQQKNDDAKVPGGTRGGCPDLFGLSGGIDLLSSEEQSHCTRRLLPTGLSTTARGGRSADSLL